MINMTREELVERCHGFFEGCEAILRAKGKDYAEDGNAFRNFEEAAADTNSTIVQVIWVHLLKHWSALRHFVKRGDLASEGIASRLQDIANYCAILAAAIQGQDDKEAVPPIEVVDTLIKKFGLQYDQSKSDKFTVPPAT